jgi:1,4-dihydroxy-2-naphthoate octaprenyltransferase
MATPAQHDVPGSGPTQERPPSPPVRRSPIQNWLEILRTQNLSPGVEMDTVSKWLIIVRASVFPMTLTSGVIGGLLVVAGPTPVDASWLFFAEALFGIMVAHAANNMINDYFDLQGGVDSGEYVRGQYALHPILNGLISKKGLIAAIAVANLIDLAILVHLTAERGWPVVVFALLGLFISVFYVAPPLKLKHHGLGEPGVVAVWGPLMIGGTYFVTAGEVPAWVWAACLPYAVLVGAVLFGKHIDKLPADSAKGIRTLPVILGDERARWTTQVLFASFFVLVGVLVLAGVYGVWCLLVFAAAPKAWQISKVFTRPKPDAQPPDFPIWPLWFVAWAFVFTRLAGGLLAVGLVANAIYPVFL